MEIYFKQNLKFLRKSKNLTLLDLGKALNISKSAISDYENGKSTPSLAILELIGNYFNISISNLTNSIISELTDIQNIKAVETKLSLTNQNNFENKLLQQQISNLEMQIQLIKQLLDSKDAHIQALNLQIKLLEEKLKTKY